jgi:capsular polysaccharide biosynthesis protein
MSDRADALLSEIVTARQPAQALRHTLERLLADTCPEAAHAGAALFESVWYTLPPFEDDGIAEAAAQLYRRAGRPDGAFLMAGLAAQLRGVPAQLAAPTPATAGIAARADAVPLGPHAGAAVLHALEQLEPASDWAGSAALFERVWPRVAPMLEFWVYYRVAHVYAAMGRHRASALMAGIAVQIEPATPVSDAAYRRVLYWFENQNRVRDAAMLCRRRAALCPQSALLPPEEYETLLASAGALPDPMPPAGRSDRQVFAASVRPPAKWRSYGGDPESLRELRGAMPREAISVAEITDAEVLLDRGAVAVFGPDGLPHIDLSLRDYPAMVRRALDEARRAGGAVEEISLDEAVLAADEFSGPNLCHFMFDHASRMAVYRAAGIDTGAVAVIGPELRAEYQFMVGEQAGMRNYVASTRRARLRVGRLWVSSNCRALRHPAHWGSDWAVGVARGGFDLTRQTPRRLLISRADSPFRRIANEAEVAEVLGAFGFETIVPGRMSFADQIAAFRDATHVVGPHGAGMANIVFCGAGAHVLEAFHPLYGTWAYAMVAPPLGLDYASMVGRDGESDDPQYNDPSLPQARRNEHAGRDMRVDLDQLCQWLLETGA